MFQVKVTATHIGGPDLTMGGSHHLMNRDHLQFKKYDDEEKAGKREWSLRYFYDSDGNS